MSTQLFKNARLIFPAERVATGSLLVRDGKIAALDPREIPSGTIAFDCRGRLLTPGLIDLHTHGIQEFRYDYDTSREDFTSAACVLGQYGTTCVFPTLVPRNEPNLVGNLRPLAAMLPGKEGNRGACMPGVHLEGPFMALGGAAWASMPGDLQLLDALLAACEHRVAIMSISPDQKNILPVIERLCERGIVPFITHTRASVEQTQAAIEAGAVHATHFVTVQVNRE